MKRFPFAKIKAFLNDYDNKFNKINWGGCAVSAAILAQHLEPFVDELRIVAFDRWSPKGDVDEARNYVNNNTVQDWNEHGIAFSHVWVEFKWLGRWYGIDSEGLHSRKKQRKEWGIPYKGSFTLEEMNTLGMSPRGWNWSFDRNQIPHMRKFVKRGLAPILQAA